MKPLPHIPFLRSTLQLFVGLLIAMPAQAVPILEWSWTTSSVEPSATNVMSVPSVIDLTGDGVPEVVFGSTASAGGGLIEVGFLRAISGSGGADLFTVTATSPDLRVNTTVSVATGDIDNDGLPEIVAADTTGTGLIAFENDGTFKWRSSNLETNFWGAPAIADLDEDGTPEIVMGRQVLDNNGNLLWTGTGGRANQGSTGPLSLVSDVNNDGSPDVVAGNTVYDAAGAIQSGNIGLPDGYNAVGNFDGDDEAEIVLVSAGSVRLLDADLSVIWGPVAIPGGGVGGPPTIADFDNDGEPEIGVAGAVRYVVYETDGTVRWTVVVQDGSSNRTGSSVFDFTGDGSAEVVYSDELQFYILAGTDGTILFNTPLSSCTWHEYPLVADVDNDGSAEIVVAANNNCGFGPQSGIYVFGDDADAWVSTRPIWNQHTYHITNILLDGTIPQEEQLNWLQTNPTLNNFRLNEFGPGEAPSIPEPSILALMGLGLAGLACARRRRNR